MLSGDSVKCLDISFSYKREIRNGDYVYCVNTSAKPADSYSHFKIRKIFKSGAYSPHIRKVKKVYVSGGVQSGFEHFCKGTPKVFLSANKSGDRIILKHSCHYKVIHNENKLFISDLYTTKDIVYVADTVITVDSLHNKAVSGGGLEGFNFIVQKNSFTVISFTMKENRIISVTGLPEGMGFDGNMIKGTPLLSGDYPISLMLENGEQANGKIEIPTLTRSL